jgi:hypothetical protein
VHVRFAPKADKKRTSWNVRFVPKADMRPRFETIRADVRRPPANEITVSRMEKRLEETPSLRDLSALWPAQSEITLSAEDIVVKACSRADS